MNFKRILFLFLVLATAFAFVACGKDDTNDTPTPEPDVDDTIKYTVTFDYAGVLEQSIEKDAKATEPTAPKKDGYTFCGWLLNGETFNFDTPITGDITLTPSWETTKYTITFMDGKTEITNLKKTYTIEDSDIVLASISKEHYNFMGWYKDPTFTESIQKVARGSFGDLTLYVQFTVKNYGITYNLDGGNNADGNPSSYNINTEFPVLLADPNRDGYEFAGWYTDAEFTNQFVGIADITAGNVSVYAKWNKLDLPNCDDGHTFVDGECTVCGAPDPSVPPVIVEKEYTITYMDGTTVLELTPNKYVSGHALAIPEISKAHFVFAGWYTTETFDEGTEAVIDETTTGNLVLYAKFLPVSYSITYVLNGGENDPENLNEYTVEDKDFQFKNPTKEGHVFHGWYLDPEFKIQVSTLRGRADDLILYAKWEQTDDSGILTPPDEF